MVQKPEMIKEIFASIQGEGSSAGVPTWFIRLLGCNRTCHWCDERRDTNMANTDKARQIQSPEELVAFISSSRPYIPAVTFTGGEPTLHRGFIEQVIDLDNGREYYLETNGDFLDGLFFNLFRGVAVSPKLSSSGRPYFLYRDLGKIIHETGHVYAKFVIGDFMDYQEAKGHIEKHELNRNACYMQPVNGVLDFKDLWQFWFEFPVRNVRLLPQVHKLVGLK